MTGTVAWEGGDPSEHPRTSARIAELVEAHVSIDAFATALGHHAFQLERELTQARTAISDGLSENERMVKAHKTFGQIIHDMTVGNQAAWIEWRHGKGADAAMQWIENGLFGPGLIPDEDAPWGKEAQAFYDANKSEPFPTCFCGRPSNRVGNGKGWCSEAHYQEDKARETAK